MTPQERQLLERFLSDMVAARVGQKDPDAEALIRDAVSRQPDAVYLLVQRAIQLDQALQLTQGEMERLKAELEQAKAAASNAGSGGGFLGGADPYAWGSRPPNAAPVSAAPQQPVQPVQPVGAAPYQAPARPLSGGWGGSGVLGTVAATAAGVVAGSFLFQGIEHLMHRDDHAASAGDRSHGFMDSSSQQIAGDSTGFDDIVPDDDELRAAGDDDSNVS